MKLLTFERHFKDDEQDKKLKHLLKDPANISGIFNSLIEGYKLMKKDGLKPPQFMSNDVNQYKEENDTLGQFTREWIIKTPHNKTLMKEVYLCYEAWCKENGSRPMDSKSLNAELRRRDMEIKPSNANKLYLFGHGLSDGSGADCPDPFFDSAFSLQETTPPQEEINPPQVDLSEFD